MTMMESAVSIGEAIAESVASESAEAEVVADIETPLSPAALWISESHALVSRKVDWVTGEKHQWIDIGPVIGQVAISKAVSHSD